MCNKVPNEVRIYRLIIDDMFFFLQRFLAVKQVPRDLGVFRTVIGNVLASPGPGVGRHEST